MNKRYGLIFFSCISLFWLLHSRKWDALIHYSKLWELLLLWSISRDFSGHVFSLLSLFFFARVFRKKKLQIFFHICCINKYTEQRQFAISDTIKKIRCTEVKESHKLVKTKEKKYKYKSIHNIVIASVSKCVVLFVTRPIVIYFLIFLSLYTCILLNSTTLSDGILSTWEITKKNIVCSLNETWKFHSKIHS